MNYQPGVLRSKGATAFADVLGSSMLDAIGFAGRLRLPLIILAVIYVVRVTLFNGDSAPDAPGDSGNIAAEVPFECVILWFFALAAAVRTIQPGFRLTLGRFFSYVGWTILTWLTIMLGFVAFLIPGFWLMGRLGYAPEIALLRPGRPFSRSWNCSARFFWPTLALLVIVAMATSMLNAPAQAMSAVISVWNPAGLVLGPIAFAIFAFGTVLGALSSVRWANELLLEGDEPTAMALTPGGAAGIVP